MDSAANSGDPAVKRRLRFSPGEDLILLREVFKQNPYSQTSKWKDVQAVVVELTGKNFSVRAIKEHSELLLKIWTKEDHGNSKRSCTGDQYTEKEQLLDQIARQCKDSNNFPGTRRVKIPKKDFRDMSILNGDGSMICSEVDESCDHLIIQSCNSVSDLTMFSGADPSPKSEVSQETVADSPGKIQYDGHENTSWKSSAFTVLSERPSTQYLLQEKEIEMQERKLALEERKLKLEEEKWKWEKEEREKRLIMELEERRHKLALEDRHQNILSVLIQELHKK